MPLISESDRQYLIEHFGAMKRPVRISLTTDDECQTCSDTRAILDELADLSDMIQLEVIDRTANSAAFDAVGVTGAPVIELTDVEGANETFGIRYLGIPSGYEFGSLVEDLMMIGGGESGLSNETKRALDGLEAPVHMRVFVTPTCPYCPQAVRLAHQMAFYSPNVRADMVEAMEFPEMSQKYGVMGVPRTVINETVHIEGAVPEQALLPKVLESVAMPA